jgi:hypothetical protein
LEKDGIKLSNSIPLSSDEMAELLREALKA